jgi:hypothetical protein
MSEIRSKYQTGQRQIRSRRDDVMEKDNDSQCKTQTKSRT